MDAEDLKLEMDKIDQAQLGKKTEINFEQVKSDVEELVSLAKAGQRQQAIDGLLAIEKQGRIAEDPASTRLACTKILQVWLWPY
jgi:hypothetical protein